jgi:predicted acyl esterase
MADSIERIREKRQFGNESVEVIFRKSQPLEKNRDRHPPLVPGVTVENGIRIERAVPVTLRDGVKIYVDIYRPEGAGNLPSIIAWSPYGKLRFKFYDNLHMMAGVPNGMVSKWAKWEAPDPAFWCHHGYAVINPDARGAGGSEGNIFFWGTQEGRDCSDLIEWVAEREWSNGKVGMSGNSWLGIVQWFTAAEQPPHLAAIAPWEGDSDIYRGPLCPGGIPEKSFINNATGILSGNGYTEDMYAMISEYPLMNAYWEDKIAKYDKINVPAYVVASYLGRVHTRGTFEAFQRMSPPNKWLRIHNTNEWLDYYNPEHILDLKRFFDRYLKDIHNGWEFTPRVRMSVLDPGGTDIIDRPEQEFPLARTQHRTLFLDAKTGKLTDEAQQKEGSVSYDAVQGLATFTWKFKGDTEVTGYIKLHLWVEADGANDMDLFVDIAKLGRDGKEICPVFVGGSPFHESTGFLRVSHRELDKSKSTMYRTYHTHRSEKLLNTKEIVSVDIELLPVGMLWHAGEQLSLTISGHYVTLAKVATAAYDTRNSGTHIIHTGGKYDSYLQIPVIPPK